MSPKMEQMKSLVEVTCDIMREIVDNVCDGDKKFSGLNFDRIAEEAKNAVLAKEVNLLTRGALEEKILEIAGRLKKE
jgi:hypothetical protein